MPHPQQPDRRAYALEWQGLQSPDALHSPVRDPLLAAGAGRQALGSSDTGIYFGHVVDAIAYTHCYRVFLEGGRTPRMCTLLTQSPLLPFGSHQLNTLPPGTAVWVLIHDRLRYGLIIGAEPNPSADPRAALSDWIHQSSRCGLRTDRYHNAIFELKNSIVNWSAGRPFDSTTAGEWGAITETGMRLFLDSFMAQVAADEATGLFVFYHDQLTRLCGPNLQLFSAGHECEYLDDEGEIWIYDGSTPYPWEQMGQLTQGTDALREVPTKEVQIDPACYATLEPADDKQQPFHRTVRYGGYLGQGGKLVVQAPPAEETRWKYDEEKYPIGLLDIQQTLPGALAIQAAHSVTIAKRLLIPGPRRLRRPEDPTGDTAEDYKAAGVQGEGPEHKVKARVATAGETQHLQQAAGILDVHAHLFNWEGVHPFHYHTKDWGVLEQSELETHDALFDEPDFDSLGTQQYMDRPSPVDVKIDHRYGDVQLFPNTSYLNLLDDGGVVIGDGYGAEIRMTGGQVFITAPGDIFLQSGRNTVTLAGHDVVQRARKSVDISASEHDVRIKAQNNLHALGKGVLVESTAIADVFDYADKVGEDVATGGIQFKAADSSFIVWAADIYLRTGGGDVDGGDIVLDADAGNADVITHSQHFTRYIGQEAADYFGAETPETANVFTATQALLGTALSVSGSGVFSEDLTVNGWVRCPEGHIATALAGGNEGKVSNLDNKALQGARDKVLGSQTALEEALESGEDEKQATFDDGLYSTDREGHDDIIESAHFTFRSDAQYGTAEYRLYEARWQQLARLFGQGEAWEEEALENGPAAGHYPYPGQGQIDSNTLVQQTPQLFDDAVRRDRDRGAIYEQPAHAAPTLVELNSSYLVIG